VEAVIGRGNVANSNATLMNSDLTEYERNLAALAQRIEHIQNTEIPKLLNLVNSDIVQRRVKEGQDLRARLSQSIAEAQALSAREQPYYDAVVRMKAQLVHFHRTHPTPDWNLVSQ
jgi:ppGpp synthetase/RelA/SpoT-type nucleotidyltranferase